MRHVAIFVAGSFHRIRLKIVGFARPCSTFHAFLPVGKRPFSMRLPRRPNRSTQAIPSIHTAFPIAPSSQSSSTPNQSFEPNQSPEGFIEDGIEVVPLERSNSTCAKIVSPCTDDKELASPSPLEKPLPGLPCTRVEPAPRRGWARWPKRQRITIIILMQLFLLGGVSLALGLMFSPNSPIRW